MNRSLKIDETVSGETEKTLSRIKVFYLKAKLLKIHEFKEKSTIHKAIWVAKFVI